MALHRRISSTFRRIVIGALLTLTAGSPALEAQNRERLDDEIASARAVLEEMSQHPDRSIPDSVRNSAACLIVIPSSKKGAFIVGGNYGHGVATCRTQQGWSEPVFITLEGGLFGFAMGGSSSDLIMVALGNRDWREHFKSKIRIGSDVIASSGPIGRDRLDSTVLAYSGQLLTYSRTKGLFAGVDINGATLSAEENSNRDYYDSSRSTRDLLNSNIRTTGEAARFTQSMHKLFPDNGYHAGPPENHGAYAGNPAVPEKNYQIVKIFYATDRELGPKIGDIQTFTGKRSQMDNYLSLGEGEVSIPRDHKMGELESPSLLRLEFREDPEKHIVLLKAQSLSEESFESALRNKLRDDPKKSALIFVHGYRVSFEDGARRLGQLAYDLAFAGAPILYSWPSRGTFLGYTDDEDSSAWSAAHFLEFLQTLHRDKDIKNIYIIGHSMGNRVVAGALSTLASTSKSSPLIANEVIMAAPDIDAGLFQGMANAALSTASRFTIYESSKDLALQWSHTFHDDPRLGDTNPNVHVLKQYECIEASSLKTDFFGHSYIGDNTSILGDVYDLINKGAPASQRFRLTNQTFKGLPYWSFKK